MEFYFWLLFLHVFFPDVRRYDMGNQLSRCIITNQRSLFLDSFLQQFLVNGFIVEMLHVSTDDSCLKDVILEKLLWSVLSVFITTIENKFKRLATVLEFKDGMAKIL